MFRSSLVIVILLAWPCRAGATIPFFSGFETGDTSEWLGSSGATNGTKSTLTTTPRTGNYYEELVSTTSAGNVFIGVEASSSGFAAATIFARFYLKIAATSANITASHLTTLFELDNAASAQQALTVSIGTDASSNPSLSLFIETGSGTYTQVGSATAVTTGVYHRIEVEANAIAGAGAGIAILKIDGTTAASTTTATYFSLTNMNTAFIEAQQSASTTLDFDDVIFNTAAFPGPGQIIARQCNTTTPNYNAWTKSNASTIDTVWDNTPFTSATNATDASNNVDKQSCVTDFTITGGTGSTGHGTQTVGASDTINAFKVSAIGKTSSTTTDGADSTIFRTPAGGGGVDTTTALAAWTTADTYQENINASAPTAAQVRGCEVGMFKGTGTNTHTIEDIWGQVDYLPASGCTHHDILHVSQPGCADVN